MAKHDYKSAGVDIGAATQATDKIKKYARATLGPEVLSGPGFFSGMYEFTGYKNPVLVTSADGVGTKLMIANAMSRHDTVGIDLVNHCINDIFTCGAKPIFFLDYIAVGKLNPDVVANLVKGLSEACGKAGCALIGGETAEMPGMYKDEDYDLAGFIVGVIEKDRIINGKNIKEGDVILGLPSSGLHTNGYSLVRKIFGQKREDMEKVYPELDGSLGDALLKPHRCYFNDLSEHLHLIKGMAHITGGGLIDNVPRCLPEGVAAEFDSTSWETPPIFKLIQKQGSVDEKEMYHVFNMGIGMVVICSPDNASELKNQVGELTEIGKITAFRDEKVIIK